MSGGARTAPARRARDLTGPQRVWLLTVAMIAASAALAWNVRDWGLLQDDQFHVPWWALASIVYIAEITVVHLRFHRHAHSFSMSEVPLVVGLFMSTPLEMLVAQLVGNAVALVVNRRQPTLKLAFNLSLFTLEGALGIAVFRLIAGLGEPLGWAGWLGALVSMQVGVILANILINAAIRMSGGKLDRREQVEVLSLTSLAAAMNTSLALVGVTILWTAQATAWLAIVPPVVLFLAYRAYITQRQERSRLESLYKATRVLHESPQIESALVAAAEYAMDMFEAEIVEIALLSQTDDTPTYLTAIGPGTQRIVMEPTDLGDAEPAWRAIARHGGAQLIEDPEKAFPRSDVVIDDAIAAPLTGDHGALGVLLIANRLGDVSHFDRSDVRLLETFASQLSVSLENGRLEDSLVQLTELKEELRHQASHDSLTALANRSLFSDRVERAIERCASTRNLVAVLFLDLDDFKTVNDSLGHAAGDSLLVQVADRLRRLCRPDDVVARLGGDEFAVLLERLTDPRESTEIADRILDGLRAPFLVEGKQLSVRSSVGIAFGGYDDDRDQLLRNADAAMYAAKHSGKGTYRIFEDAMHAEMIRRLELKADLTNALDREELRVLYQPIVDLESGFITGVEALVRWEHPVRGSVAPGEFIPFAEETGLIVPIGRHVLDEACRRARMWQDKFPDSDITMAVNLSPRQLADIDIVSEVARAINTYGVAEGRLTLEITENVLMQTAVRTLVDLRDLGVRLAIDDFGTGYSSLSYLDRLPIDIVKIDKSFVARLNPDEESALVRTVIQIGHAIGLDTVVEGIETSHQLQRLRELGCRKGQGYFLATPMLPEQLEELLAFGSDRSLIPPSVPPGRPGGRLRIIG